MIPNNSVPEDTLTPTSVLLTWEAIPSDDANGELTYIVMVEVTGQNRRKRQTNTLQQCLDAAGITNQFDISVPGDQTSTTLTGIGMGLIYNFMLLWLSQTHNMINSIIVSYLAPFTGYSYSVSGNTSAGLGPSSAAVPFSTREGSKIIPNTYIYTLCG